MARVDSEMALATWACAVQSGITGNMNGQRGALLHLKHKPADRLGQAIQIR
jgi:hypothetical protein